ncbi:MAG: hypothetical protein JWR83_3535 [Aeromicrobium sp.]|nr:hypothetical protein [Aeromicrobium sp.]
MKHISSRRILSSTALVVTIGLGLAACGGSSPAATGGAEGGQPTAAQGAGGGRTPGGSGEVTDVSGSTAQVQSQTAQVAVTWTGSTTFTQQVSVKAAAVTVGSCAVVTSSATGTTTTDPVQASTVRITPATNGSCTAGFGGGGGRPQGQGGTPPTGRPSGAPGGAGGRGGFGGGTFGKVTAVSSTGFTVESQGRPTSSGTTGTTTSVSVVTSASTKYTSTEKASSSAVKVGRCVTSQGQADSTGAITATSIAVTDPVNGQCGFGGFGGGQPAGGQS